MPLSAQGPNAKVVAPAAVLAVLELERLKNKWRWKNCRRKKTHVAWEELCWFYYGQREALDFAIRTAQCLLEEKGGVLLAVGVLIGLFMGS